ncbi:hypothetical protein AEY52_05335 [Helicobacter pylori]|nr:hypothetical protein AEY52_05335 [Helicobacter pylori]
MFWVCCKNDFLNCKNDFLNFLREVFCNHFQLKGLLVKAGLSLSFGCMRLLTDACLARNARSFKQGFERFLKLN